MRITVFPVHVLAAGIALMVTYDVVSAALPTGAPGSTVSIYAEFPTRPGRISFDELDNLYVGNFNEPGPPNGPANFSRVDAGDASITTCGPIDDPDAVHVDRNGILGSPGDILIGGWKNFTSIGQISSAAPDCNGISVVGSGGCLGNINEFAEDSLGRLYVTNASELNVCRFDGNSWSQFLPALASISRISIDGANVYISFSDIVRRYDLNGVEQDPMITTGELLTVGPTGLLIVARSGELLAVDPVSKAEWVILSDVVEGISDAEFNSMGNLFVVQNSAYRILRVEMPIATAVSPSINGTTFLSVFPNPSSGSTEILYRSSALGTRVEIFDSRGRRVRTFSRGNIAGELQRFSLNADELPSGVYFLRGGVGGRSVSKKLIVLR